MKVLQWIAAVFAVGAIGDISTKMLSHRMANIDKTMQGVVSLMTPKLPTTNDIGLMITRMEYHSPTMRQYFSVPRGTDPEGQYKQTLTNTMCTDQAMWMFHKGFRIENIFQQEAAPSAMTLDLGVSDQTIVIDEKQCQHRGVVSTYVAPAVTHNGLPDYAQQAAQPSYSQAPDGQSAAAAPDMVASAPTPVADTAAAVR